jgi:hypothetical protein
MPSNWGTVKLIERICTSAASITILGILSDSQTMQESLVEEVQKTGFLPLELLDYI